MSIQYRYWLGAWLIVGMLYAPPEAAAHTADGGTSPDIAKVNLQVDIRGNIDTCLTQSDFKNRMDCLAQLCDPSLACAQALLIDATVHQGTKVGMNLVADFLQEPLRFNIVTDGHELAHIVGRTNAKIKGATGTAFQECPVDQLYGCQHGFFEQALADNPQENPRDIAVGICTSVTAAPIDRSQFYCYHGVGHGMMMAQKNDVYGVLRFCNSLPRIYDARGCWQGVFMENINAQANSEARPEVFRPDDPLAPCSNVPLGYQWHCYESQAGYLMRYFQHDIAQAAEACLKAHELSQPACILGLAQLTVTPDWQQLMITHTPSADRGDFINNAIALCQKFPTSWVEHCYHSAVNYALNYDWYDESISYCSNIPRRHQTSCWRRLGNELRGRRILTGEAIEAICAAVPPKHRAACEKGGEVSTYQPVRLSNNELMTRNPQDPLPTPRMPESSSSLLSRLTAWFAQQETTDTPADLPASLNEPQQPGGASAASPQAAGVNVDSLIIRLTTAGTFSPPEVTIQTGQTVTWINETGETFWPASDVHPTHQLLPQLDAARPLPAASAYSFTFMEAGAWTFHDHLHPQATGVVHVQ